MYTLREISPGYPVSNEALGDRYTVVLKEQNPTQFVETCKMYWETESPGHAYGFVICRDGSKIIPLIEGNYYYVMTDSGKTFENLTLK